MFCPALLASFVMQAMQARPDVQQSAMHELSFHPLAMSSFPAVCYGCAGVQMWPCTSGQGWYDISVLWRPFAFPYNVMADVFVPKKGAGSADHA
jgi:hypothetical protein